MVVLVETNMKSAVNHVVFVKSRRKLGICSYAIDNKASVTFFIGKESNGRPFGIYWRSNVVALVRIPSSVANWFCYKFKKEM